MKASGVPRMRLHDARHACLTYLTVSGLAGALIVSARAGRADLNIAQRGYVHRLAKDLEQARDALDALLGGPLAEKA